MSTLYSGALYAPKKSTVALVLATHGVLQRLGLTLADPPNVWVDDWDLDEEVPDYTAVDLQDAIQYMRGWPCSTALEYFLPSLRPAPQDPMKGIAVTVFFSSRGTLSKVGLSLSGSVFRANEFPDAHPRIVAVIEALHDELEALRSGFDWGLSDVVDEEAEARAVEQHDLQPRPSQWLDIVDKSLVTPNIKWMYQQEARPDSVLRTTANGSLFWQRDAGPP
jgi:hypothetical protein